MLTSSVLAEAPGFSVAAVRCAARRSGWSSPEAAVRHQVVLVRSGRFRLWANGHQVGADPTVGYLHRPGDEVRFAHPAGGDVCTAITFAPGLWHDIAGDTPAPPAPPIYVDGRLDLAHRRLVRAAPDAAFAVAEHLLDLLAVVVRQAGGSAAPSRAVPGRRGAAVVERAREALICDHPDAAGLFSLARLLEVSPYHLSRLFRHETGITLTRYRNRVRVARALDLIEQGADNLADVAAATGFADQAHLARTVKAQSGHTPGELRRLLRPGRGGPEAQPRGPVASG